MMFRLEISFLREVEKLQLLPKVQLSETMSIPTLS